ncbi:hypothetical protein, partial [Burkholderia ambifaria]
WPDQMKVYAETRGPGRRKRSADLAATAMQWVFRGFPWGCLPTHFGQVNHVDGRISDSSSRCSDRDHRVTRPLFLKHASRCDREEPATNGSVVDAGLTRSRSSRNATDSAGAHVAVRTASPGKSVSDCA